MAAPLNTELASRVYSILIEHCSAPATEEACASFVYAESNAYVQEYRFCGALGFGGKFRRSEGRMFVNCYREDETPEVLAMIERANAALSALHDDTSNGPPS